MVQTRSATAKSRPNEARKAGSQVGATEVPLEGTQQLVTTKRSRRLQEVEPGEASAKKRRRGKPEKLCQLNLDVLFLLAAYVDSLDLLNLSRTCKSLRELLMDKSSIFVWKTARRQVVPTGLPECPDDLTEPQYANLVFCARCHNCGKHAPIILWYIRRRYCATCRKIRLRRLLDCDELIRENGSPIPEEFFRKKERYGHWVDIDQMNSFLDDYHALKKPAERDEYLKSMREQRDIIRQQARRCELWQQDGVWERRARLQARRADRETAILERLGKSGFDAEVRYFGAASIRCESEPAFKISKPLTDQEWARLSPRFIYIMKKRREHRLEITVYALRRQSIRVKFDRYVQETLRDPASDGKDILPDEISAVPLIDAIIKAPEGSPMNETALESAFAQLSTSVVDWRQNITSELVALLNTHHSTSTATRASNRLKTRKTHGSKLPKVSTHSDSDKLQLACALFSVHRDAGLYAHPALLFLPLHRHCLPYETDEASTTTRSWAKKSITLCEAAAEVVRACGLDPNLATVDDMERRNARLVCLICEGPRLVRTWAAAVRHANSFHVELPHHLKNPGWCLVEDSHLDAIRAVERVAEEGYPFDHSRCLLCRPRVGDAWWRDDILFHLSEKHDIMKSEIKRGVHYEPLELLDIVSTPAGKVEMVKEGERVLFREIHTTGDENE